MSTRKLSLKWLWILATFYVFGVHIVLSENHWIRKRSNFKKASAEEESSAVKQLLLRLIPAKVDQFRINVNFSFDQGDAFQIENEEGKILITGNRGYSAAAGVHHYLKYFCSCHISWSGQQLNLPNVLPKPPKPLKIAFNDKYRYYQNVCTASYSSVWWTWKRWEKEIDWMALNGINLPLAFTAQEAITEKVFKQLNFTQHEVGAFFTGPAFLAWNRMGNVQSWVGPLSDNWHKIQVGLQHQILDRMRLFGMTPVLPAFSGRVVPSFSRLFPNASVTSLGNSWGHFLPPFSNVSFLEPTDPMFQEIGVQFLKEYIKEFGTDHVYNADLFNEMPPPSNDTNYLKKASKSVYKSLTEVDPDAIWLTQGWMFFSDPDFWQEPQAKAFLEGVPLGKMIVLDLQSELYPQYHRLPSYYGQPFIWCMLHNYGGVLGLYGSMENINKGPFDGRIIKNSTMIGTGITPEGIETNDVVYELMNEMAWRKDPVKLDDWLKEYTTRRYGNFSSDLFEAWKFLKKSVYNATVPYRNHGKYILIQRPSLKLKPYVWYDPKDVFSAWRLFVNASEELSISEQKLFRHDLVDVTRQSMQLVMDFLYSKYVQAFRKKSIRKTRKISQIILKFYNDTNELLMTDESFLLGKWLEAAKSFAKEPQEKRQYEYNARNQITLWGPTGQILDYANKQWAGLITAYYQQRWKLFFEVLDDCLVNRKPFKQSDFNKMVLLRVEIPFNLDDEAYPISQEGDSIKISKRLLRRYGHIEDKFSIS